MLFFLLYNIHGCSEDVLSALQKIHQTGVLIMRSQPQPEKESYYHLVLGIVVLLGALYFLNRRFCNPDGSLNLSTIIIMITASVLGIDFVLGIGAKDFILKYQLKKRGVYTYGIIKEMQAEKYSKYDAEDEYIGDDIKYIMKICYMVDNQIYWKKIVDYDHLSHDEGQVVDVVADPKHPYRCNIFFNSIGPYEQEGCKNLSPTLFALSASDANFSNPQEVHDICLQSAIKIVIGIILAVIGFFFTDIHAAFYISLGFIALTVIKLIQFLTDISASFFILLAFIAIVVIPLMQELT